MLKLMILWCEIYQSLHHPLLSYCFHNHLHLSPYTSSFQIFIKSAPYNKKLFRKSTFYTTSTCISVCVYSTFRTKAIEPHNFTSLKMNIKRADPIGSALILLHYQYNTLFNEISSKKVPNKYQTPINYIFNHFYLFYREVKLMFKSPSSRTKLAINFLPFILLNPLFKFVSSC